MHIKSIVSDEDREELERMLSLGFIIPNQLFKTRQKSRMIIYIFTPVEFYCRLIVICRKVIWCLE